MSRPLSLSLAPLVLLAGTAFAQPATWPDLRHPQATTAKLDGKDAALVIGVEDYASLADLPGTRQLASSWAGWLEVAAGVSAVELLLDEAATTAAMQAAWDKAARKVKRGGRLWVVFIGHGVAVEDGSGRWLLGADASGEGGPGQGLPLDGLMEGLPTLLPKDAQAVLLIDASLGSPPPDSGPEPRSVSHSGHAPPAIALLLGASGSEQVDLLPNEGPPAFSYLMLGALRGWGDSNENGGVTASEAVGYVGGVLSRIWPTHTLAPTWQGPDLILGVSAMENDPDLSGLLPPLPVAPVTEGGGTAEHAADLALGDHPILGALDKSLIDAVIRKNMADVRHCYQLELPAHPELRGKITVKFVISKEGAVIKAEIKSSTMESPEVESCIVSVFMQMRYPEPKGGGIVIVSYPFVFSPG